MSTPPPKPSEPQESAGPRAHELAGIRRVRRAYEQVADQVRELIATGQLKPGERLPDETTLAKEFGVARGTVREALRVLSTEALLRTSKGPSGGSFVEVPTTDHISAFLQSNISMLTRLNQVSIEEFLEAREQLEIPAARLAAERRDDQRLAELGATIPADLGERAVDEQFVCNREFHSHIVRAADNVLLLIATQPVFAVLQANLIREDLPDSVLETIGDDHRAIYAAIEAGDADRAGEHMRAHLANLVPIYQRFWRYSIRGR
jgi:GntR family transcriptional repressor for pyruvate dehydrogenase complex